MSHESPSPSPSPLSLALALASQPLFSEEKSEVLVVNGEIYNHKELRAGLEAKGYKGRPGVLALPCLALACWLVSGRRKRIWFCGVLGACCVRGGARSLDLSALTLSRTLSCSRC